MTRQKPTQAEQALIARMNDRTALAAEAKRLLDKVAQAHEEFRQQVAPLEAQAQQAAEQVPSESLVLWQGHPVMVWWRPERYRRTAYHTVPTVQDAREGGVHAPQGLLGDRWAFLTRNGSPGTWLYSIELGPGDHDHKEYAYLGYLSAPKQTGRERRHLKFRELFLVALRWVVYRDIPVGTSYRPYLKECRPNGDMR